MLIKIGWYNCFASAVHWNYFAHMSYDLNGDNFPSFIDYDRYILIYSVYAEYVFVNWLQQVGFIHF
jgi:hypothetical protein